MTKSEILTEIEKIFEDVFDEEIKLNDDTTAEDVDGWDSLTHITLIAAVEETFDLKFKMKEVSGMKDVGEMIDIIYERGSA